MYYNYRCFDAAKALCNLTDQKALRDSLMEQLLSGYRVKFMDLVDHEGNLLPVVLAHDLNSQALKYALDKWDPNRLPELLSLIKSHITMSILKDSFPEVVEDIEKLINNY